MVGFNRTLHVYAETLCDTGFLIATIDGPIPTPAALGRMFRHFADYRCVPLFFILEAIRPYP